ncbi:MAG: 2-phosphosulfolactate phosphatase [Thermodesulfobacteriota bacterium]
MDIIRTRLAEGARESRGTAVIIDVFRAFSCVPFFFHFGAKRIFLEADPDKAVSIKKSRPGWILAGEINEIPIEGGDLGNSPSEVLLKGREFFRGKTVVHRTTAGVTGATAALQCADEVLLGSFLTAAATARYIRVRKPGTVTLVAMGSRALEPAPEDEACAAYLEHLISGRAYDHSAALRDILFAPSAEKFLRGEKGYLPPEDPVLCLQRDLFDMVLGAEHKDGRVVVTRKA